MMKALRKAIGRITVLAILASASFGCASIPATYRPKQTGLLPGEDPVEGLVMALQLDSNSAHIGDLLTFVIIVENVGSETMWIPATPEILLSWVYPDGKCDNFVTDADSNAPQPVLAPLAPREERRFRSCVPTYYFDRKGVTEFRARMSVPRRNPSATGLVWMGDIVSNGYGVMFSD